MTTSPTSTSVHAGLAVADSQLEAETNRYLRERLALFFLVSAVSSAAFYIVAQVVHLASGRWTPALVLGAGPLVHLASIVFASLGLWRLKYCPPSLRQLRSMDAFLLYVSAGTLLTLYSVYFKFGAEYFLSIFCIYIILRAVLVPSRGRTTFLLSLPIPIALLVIEIAHGTYYYGNGVAFEDMSAVWSQRVWNQTILFFAIGVATVASHVNFTLRRLAHEAQLIGQYRLDRKIGEGGMGEVYLATHAMLRRPTAIKLLRPEITGDETILRFEREVREAARLTHPNTVRIYDFGHTADGLFYYAMEFLDGEDLEEMVKRCGPLPAGRVVRVLRHACRGLREAHEAGLVHRDIKPGNLMLCRRGGETDVLKIVDFGLVKDLRDTSPSLTAVGAICGTPETMAPEILEGEEPTPLSDLYALACVGIHLLTGRPVFEGRTPMDFVGHHLHSQPEPPSARGFDVPADLEALLLRCLAKDPSDRPENVTVLEAELTACADARSWSEADAQVWWKTHARPSDATAAPAETKVISK